MRKRVNDFITIWKSTSFKEQLKEQHVTRERKRNNAWTRVTRPRAIPKLASIMQHWTKGACAHARDVIEKRKKAQRKWWHIRKVRTLARATTREGKTAGHGDFFFSTRRPHDFFFHFGFFYTQGALHRTVIHAALFSGRRALGPIHAWRDSGILTHFSRARYSGRRGVFFFSRAHTRPFSSLFFFLLSAGPRETELNIPDGDRR